MTQRKRNYKPKKELHVIFLLDETGSMMKIRDTTIRVFNDYINNLRKNTDNIKFTLTKFNSCRTESSCVNVNLDEVPYLCESNYIPRCNTPLYDAIGRGIHLSAIYENVLFIIQTDGEENSSREYDRMCINSLISEYESKGWEFVYLGTEKASWDDAWREASSLGISHPRNVIYCSYDNFEPTMTRVYGCTMNYAQGKTKKGEFFTQ